MAKISMGVRVNRNISVESNCIPHQLTLGTHLSAEVLMPDVSALEPGEPSGTSADG